MGYSVADIIFWMPSTYLLVLLLFRLCAMLTEFHTACPHTACLATSDRHGCSDAKYIIFRFGLLRLCLALFSTLLYTRGAQPFFDSRSTFQVAKLLRSTSPASTSQTRTPRFQPAVTNLATLFRVVIPPLDVHIIIPFLPQNTHPNSSHTVAV